MNIIHVHRYSCQESYVSLREQPDADLHKTKTKRSCHIDDPRNHAHGFAKVHRPLKHTNYSNSILKMG